MNTKHSTNELQKTIEDKTNKSCRVQIFELKYGSKKLTNFGNIDR